MRYLVRALVRPGRERNLLKSIENGTLGRGSIAGDGYRRNMSAAMVCEDQTTRWVEVCYCPTPLQEERPYWEQFFELVRVQDAHDRRRCRDLDGSEPWVCSECNCTEKLERRLEEMAQPFMDALRRQIVEYGKCAVREVKAESK